MDNFRNWVERVIFSYLGVHYIDVMRYVIKQKSSASGQKSFLSKEGINTYDSIQCNIDGKPRKDFF